MTDEPGGAPGAPSTRRLDDGTLESLVRGDEVEERHGALAAFAQQVRAVADRPPPTPSPALRALFAGTAEPPLRRRGLLVAKAAGFGLTAKVALATSVAAATVGGAGAAGVLPREANRVVRDVIEAVTPIEIDRGTGGRTPADPRSPADATTHGSEVRGAPGAAGTSAPDDAPGLGGGGEGSPGDQPAPGGRASETPAATATGPSTAATGGSPAGHAGPASPAVPPTPPTTSPAPPTSTVPPAPPGTDPPPPFGTSDTPNGASGP